MSAQDEKNLGLASAVRDLSDDEFLAALEAGRSIGFGPMLRDAHAAMERVAGEEAAAQERRAQPAHAW